MPSTELQFARFVAVLHDVAQARTHADLMAVVRKGARTITGADGATIVMRDGDECHYVDEDAISPLWKGQRFPLKACISGWVMLYREPAFIEDIYADARIPVAAYKPTFVKSLGMVPIGGGDPIGALGNYWAKTHVVTAAEKKLLRAFADTVAIAIENLQLVDQLQRSRRLFTAFMDNAPFGAAIRDRSGKILFANATMATSFQRPVEQVVGRHLREVVSDPSADVIDRTLLDDRRVIDERRPETRTYVSTRRGGGQEHRYVTKFPIVGGDGEPTLGLVSIDITDRVEAEQAREQSRIQLQESYKMASLGEMAGGMAHEINNPTAVIIGKSRQLTELFDVVPVDREVAKDFAGTIVRTAQRIVGIVNGLRTISRPADRDPYSLANLATIVEGTLALTSARFKFADISLEACDFDRDIKVECRPTEISQVLLNLLGNAFDAVAELDDKWVRVEVAVEGPAVSIAVVDSGRGVPQELYPKLMSPFFTTKAFGIGTGLGLSISKGIVETHGGSLILDESRQNTCFVMRLPIAGVPRRDGDA